MQRLDGVTIEDLCNRAHQAGVAGESRALDYTI